MMKFYRRHIQKNKSRSYFLADLFLSNLNYFCDNVYLYIKFDLSYQICNDKNPWECKQRNVYQNVSVHSDAIGIKNVLQGICNLLHRIVLKIIEILLSGKEKYNEIYKYSFFRIKKMN